jgi:hypothetical protein
MKWCSDNQTSSKPCFSERLRHANLVYRVQKQADTVFPFAMQTRKLDQSPELTLVLRLIKEMYRKGGITVGT